jgi:hypothetical protein
MAFLSSGEGATAGLNLAVGGKATTVMIALIHRARMQRMLVGRRCALAAKEVPEMRRLGAWNGAG